MASRRKPFAISSSPATADTKEDDTDDYVDVDVFDDARPKVQTLDDVQSYLASRRKEQLIELLLEVALQSDEWRARLKRTARERKR